MQNKIIHDINFILRLLKSRQDFFDFLFFNGIHDSIKIEVNPHCIDPRYLDYMYKTKWLFLSESDDCWRYGVTASGRIVAYNQLKNDIEFYCDTIQDIPAQKILKMIGYDAFSDIQAYFEGVPALSWASLLREYVTICEQGNITLHPVYRKLLSGNLRDEGEIAIDFISTSVYLEENSPPFYGLIDLYDNSARKGQKYLPIIERKLFKSVTELSFPRILRPNEPYLDIALVEHMINGDDTSLDLRYIQD